MLKKDAILYRVQQEFNFSKANYDALKYEYEEAGTHHLSEANELEEKLGKIHIKMLENLNNTIGNLVEQTSELNKTMAGIAETLRWMQRK